MPGIEIKGRSKIANYRHGGRTGKFGGGRTNLLEQLGRVEAEPSNRNRRAEISRVHGELNRGYAKGGRAGYQIGGVAKAARLIAKKLKKKKKVYPETEDLTHQKGPYVGDVGSERSWPKRKEWKKPIGKFPPEKGRKMKKPIGQFPPEEGRKMQPLKKGLGPELIPPKRKNLGGVNAYQEPLEHFKDRPLGVGGRRKEFKKGGSDKKWIQKAVDPKHKGYCTPMTKKTCTPARKALARTFKKKAKTGWG